MSAGKIRCQSLKKGQGVGIDTDMKEPQPDGNLTKPGKQPGEEGADGKNLQDAETKQRNQKKIQGGKGGILCEKDADGDGTGERQEGHGVQTALSPCKQSLCQRGKDIKPGT